VTFPVKASTPVRGKVTLKGGLYERFFDRDDTKKKQTDSLPSSFSRGTMRQVERKTDRKGERPTGGTRERGVFRGSWLR